MRCTIEVDAPVDAVWDMLIHPDRWPQTWARHIKRVDYDPPGELTAETRGTLQMKEGFKTNLVMTEFEPRGNWKWAGTWRGVLTYAFDHRVMALDDARTRIDFVVETEGKLDLVLGPITGIYLGWRVGRNLPRLAALL